ncbi:MAG: helix-turn-helix domain-containing protein [Oscillospiraceae bacterium]|nr:helix-turn-helix domain-containing protein [Oscillospiraceae bacterium]
MNEEKLPAQPGYWAILPAGIRYDDRIPANAKLLYAEISSLTGETGYCFASDAYFAGLYQMTERTIRSLLKALAENGYIRIEREAGEHNATRERRIYAGLNPLAGAPASLEENFQTESAVRKKLSGSLEENFQTHIINKQENITRVRDRSEKGPREAPEWKPERFAAFWQFYRKIPGEGGRSRNENKQAAIRAWDRLQLSDVVIDVMAKALTRQLRTPEWQRGVGIPMAATYLNNARWQDAADLADEPESTAPEGRRDIAWI